MWHIGKYGLVKGQIGPKEKYIIIRVCLAERIRIGKGNEKLRSMGEKRKIHVHHLHPPFSQLWYSLH